MFHRDLVLGDAHFAHTWEYANAAARTAATGFLPADVKKLALQLDTSPPSIYLLTDDAPITWVLLNPAAAGAIATDPIWDAAGDLAVGSGANTAVKLPIGTAKQVLAVNAGATNVEYTTMAAANITVTSRTVGDSTNLDTALLNLDNSQIAQKDSGFESWGGAGNYYSIAANALTLLRAGVGYIQGRKITWAAPQTAAVFTSNSAHWLYIDSAGVLQITIARTEALYQGNIVLFEVHYDGTDYEVVWENHACAADTDIGHFLHESLGTILVPVIGTNIIGANITRVATGTGGAVGDRQLKIVGTADLNDQGLHTNIPDSAGAAISWIIYYVNGSGNWTEYSVASQFPMFYNAAGTPTALATSGSTDTGIFTCYAVKAEPNSGLPIYIAVMDATVYATDAAALAAIAAGTNSIVSGTLFQALEPAQLGHVVVTNNVSGGYISTVNIAKATARSALSGGSGASTAAGVITNVTNFDGYLSAADSNVQLALDSINKLGKKGADIASAGTTDLSTATGNYVHITGSVTITSFGTVTTGHMRHLVFDGAPLITHNGTSLILPGAANIQAVAGDTALMRSEGAGNWKCVAYTPYTVTGTGATVKATSPQISSIELGHASDTTVTRASAGVIAVENITIPSISSADTLTNKRINPRVGSTTSSATPTINTDIYDIYQLTAQTVDITSFTTNLSGTPVEGQILVIEITGTAARAITWGASFESSTVTLPATTVTTAKLTVGLLWNAVTSKWRCIASV